MIIWFKYFLLLSVATSLISQWFLALSVVCPKTALFMNLIFFFKIIFCFLSLDLCSCQYMVLARAFWLNLFTLLTCFKTNLWFNACFKFLMTIKYSVFSCKLATSLLHFQFSLCLVKMVNHYEVHVILQDI